MALDTLPTWGRVMLLALLLSIAFYGFSRGKASRRSSAVHILFRKGALVALLLVPGLVYLTNIQMPVHVDQIVRINSEVPTYFIYALSLVWLTGMGWFLFRLYSTWLATIRQAIPADNKTGVQAPSKIQSRLKHWSARLNLTTEVHLYCFGGQQGWHVMGRNREGGMGFGHSKAVVVLPAAALNWPTGVLDVALLCQLAQIKQNCWNWLLIARSIQAIFWFAPWVATMVAELAHTIAIPSVSLAKAAYRDPEGWRMDFRNYEKRITTLQAFEPGGDILDQRQPLRLSDIEHEILVAFGQSTASPVPVLGPESALAPVTAVSSETQGEEGPTTFDEGWAATQERRKAKYDDPYQQAYWLIAGASIIVAIASTLTIVKAPPDFEPEFYQVHWQDKMLMQMGNSHADEESYSASRVGTVSTKVEGQAEPTVTE